MIGSHPQIRVAIHRTGTALHDLRERLRGLASDNVDPDLVDDVVLVANELVTNAVLHTEGTVEVTAWHSPDGAWRVEVADESSVIPVSQPQAPFHQTNGRGLRIVQALASSWGVVSTPGGKRCWVEFRR